MRVVLNNFSALNKQENVLRQAVKNGLPLSMFPFLGSLPQTTNLLVYPKLPQTINLVVCICGGEGGYKLPNALVVYLKLPIWFVNWVKLAISSHSEPLQWEKIGKVVNQAKLDVESHFEPPQWVKFGKVVNRAKLLIPSHSEPLWWEKDWKSCELGKIGHSES